MAKFQVTTPEGKTFEVNAPEGATHDQVLEAAKGAASKPEDRAWGDVPMQALKNAPSSALEFGKNTVQPFLHPIDTATNIKNIGQGVLEKTGAMSTTGHEQYADAVKQFIKDRYGGMEQFKKTLAEDPVGFLGDLSSVLTAGGAGVARLPGALGKLGELAGTAGKLTNPMTGPVKAIQHGGELGAQVIGNLGTHTGGESLKQAFKAGFEGGTVGEVFRDNLRSEVPMDQVVLAARNALKDVRLQRSAEYQKGMKAIGQDSAVLSFDEVDKALAEAAKIKNFKGIDLSPSTADVRKRIQAAVTKWKSLDPAEYHTPAGMDALKQYIGDIKDSLPYNTPERLAAEKAYGAVRQTIVDQAPDYAKVMKDYETSSNLIDEISRTLSLNPKASVDTALRKLQSTMRSNVNTNFGKRTELAEKLGEKNPELMPSIAGQSLSSWTPQGLGKVTAGTLGAAGYVNPLALTALPFTSPRLMGEAAHGAGRAAGAVPESVRGVLGAIDPDTVLKSALAAQQAGKGQQ